MGVRVILVGAMSSNDERTIVLLLKRRVSGPGGLELRFLGIKNRHTMTPGGVPGSSSTAEVEVNHGAQQAILRVELVDLQLPITKHALGHRFEILEVDSKYDRPTITLRIDE